MKTAIWAALGLILIPLMSTGCGGGSSAGTDPPPTNNPPPSSTLTFVAGATLPSGGTHPKGVVVADFNGDGKLDIAVSNLDTNTVAVFLNNGMGTFGAPIVTTVQIPNGLGALSVGDFNEDGKADLVVGTISGLQANLVLLGNGDGTFRQQAPIPNSFGFFHAKVVDLNGDGHQDLVLAGNGNISVSMGRGDGTFVDTVALPAGSFPGTYFGLAVADFNGDGKVDIAAADAGSPTGGVGKLVFYAGKGDGTFQNPTSADLRATFPGALASGDFNGDGKQDLLVGFPNSALITLGNGDGTFKLDLATSIFVYTNSSTSVNGGVTVQAADLNSDGKVDAITTDFVMGTLQIALNGALGRTPPNAGIFSFALSPGLADIAVGDLNGDGVLDVVVTNNQTSQITIVLSKKQ
jgi:hypothetical protein